MAIIKDAIAGILGLQVDAQNAARAVLYGTSNALAKLRGGALVSGDSHLPVGGLADANYRPFRVDRAGGLASNGISVLLHEPFEGATVSSPNRLTVSTTTFTQAQTAAGGLNLNSGAVNTSGSAVLVTSNKQFLRMPGSPLIFRARKRIGQVANTQFELGFGNPANQTSAPTIGAYWQVTNAGVVQPVWTFNSTDVPGAAVTMPSGWQSNYYQWDVIVLNDELVFMIVDPSTGLTINEQRIYIPNTAIKTWNASHLGAFVRTHNVTAPVSAPVSVLTALDVYGLDFASPLPIASQLTFAGFESGSSPTAFTQNANYANSTVPTNATLSNTAAGYTTLGGQFSFAAVAGAETDYALFGFTVPAPYSFFCTGIEVDTINTGAIVATTPTSLQWLAVPDMTAISLATAGIRRVALGLQSFLVGAAIGQVANRLAVQFGLVDGPLVTSPGRIFVIGVKQFLGTATASQVIRGTVTVKGFFY